MAAINMDSTETQIRLYAYHSIAANTNMDNTAVTNLVNLEICTDLYDDVLDTVEMYLSLHQQKCIIR